MVDVRIPSSAPRRHPHCYAKLLRRLSASPRSGFEWEGCFVKPGALIAEPQLWPSDRYPPIPLLLECAGISKVGRGHDRSEYLYILWRYDRGRREFVEAGRSVSSSWTWAVDLAPIAQRIIDEGGTLDLGAIASRLLSYIEHELGILGDAEACAIAGVLHDVFAARILSGWVGGAFAHTHPPEAPLFTSFVNKEGTGRRHPV